MRKGLMTILTGFLGTINLAGAEAIHHPTCKIYLPLPRTAMYVSTKADKKIKFHFVDLKKKLDHWTHVEDYLTAKGYIPERITEAALAELAELDILSAEIHYRSDMATDFHNTPFCSVELYLYRPDGGNTETFFSKKAVQTESTHLSLSAPEGAFHPTCLDAEASLFDLIPECIKPEAVANPS